MWRVFVHELSGVRPGRAGYDSYTTNSGAIEVDPLTSAEDVLEVVRSSDR